MVALVADGPLMMRQTLDVAFVSRSQCGASVLWTRRRQRRLRTFPSPSSSSCSSSSSSAAAAASSSSPSSSSVSVEFPRLTYYSSSNASSVVDTFGPGVRLAAIAGLGRCDGAVVANPSRLGVAPRPAPFVRPLHAATTETAGEGLKWWERGGAPNMFDVHSTQQFVDALAAAGDKLVVVEFFASWCPSCRALFPKFCKMAAEHSDMYFLKVNFDENKPMCKSLNVKVLPFFHIYRGSEGRVDSFSCSLSKLQRLKDAIVKHHDGPCEDCAPPELIGDALDALLEKKSLDQPAAAGRSSE